MYGNALLISTAFEYADKNVQEILGPNLKSICAIRRIQDHGKISVSLVGLDCGDTLDCGACGEFCCMGCGRERLLFYEPKGLKAMCINCVDEHFASHNPACRFYGAPGIFSLLADQSGVATAPALFNRLPLIAENK